MERAVDAGLPAAMLAEQYRMHPDICAAISATFYAGKLRTGAGMAACRPAAPACRLLDVNGQEKQHPGAGFSNRQEAEALIEAAVAAARELEGLVSRDAVGRACGGMWRQAKHMVRTAKDEQLWSCVVHERHPLLAICRPRPPSVPAGRGGGRAHAHAFHCVPLQPPARPGAGSAERAARLGAPQALGRGSAVGRCLPGQRGGRGTGVDCEECGGVQQQWRCAQQV